MTGSLPKPEDERIAISRGVWEGCLLIPPSDWAPPPLLPTEIPNVVEVNEMTVTVNARLNVSTQPHNHLGLTVQELHLPFKI